MLVLTRKAQEKIQIGGNIVVTILQVKGQSVRVGIEAPRDVRVIRSELEVQSEDQNQEGAMAPATVQSPRRPGVKARRLMEQIDRFFPAGYAPEQPAREPKRSEGGLRRHVSRVARKMETVDVAGADESFYAGVAI